MWSLSNLSESGQIQPSGPLLRSCSGRSACMGRFLSRGCRKGPIHFLVPEFLCLTWQPFLRPDAHPHRRRAQKRSRMGALASIEGSSLRASSTTAHLSVSAMTTSEGSCGLVHEGIVPHACMRRARDPNHDAVYASTASSEAADPFLPTALKPCGPSRHRHLEPSSAIRHKRADRGRNRQVFLDRNPPFSVRDGG